MYKFNLELGDPSGDGHGMRDILTIKSNKPLSDVKKAYDKAVNILGFDLKDVGKNYGDNIVSQQVVDSFKKYGIDLLEEILDKDDDEYYIYPETFVDLFIQYCYIGDPELEMEEEYNENPTFPYSFGYGLYQL